MSEHGDGEESRVSAWLDGELSAGESRGVEAHLERCASCRELLASFREMRALWPGPPEPDPGFLVRFRARKEELSVAPWWTWRQLALRLLPVAAAVVFAALGAVWMSSSSGEGLGELEQAALGNPAGLVPAQASARESVLSIALEPFPEDVP